jgi:hypothetical protein
MSDPPGHPPTAMETDVKPPAGAAGPSDDGQQPVHGILKHHATTKKRPLVWDENNLENNEQERIERGPRMKIDEPKASQLATVAMSSSRGSCELTMPSSDLHADTIPSQPRPHVTAAAGR